MPFTQTLEKYASESRKYDFDFTNLLSDKDAISSVSSITDSVYEGSETTGLTVGDGSVNDPVVEVDISAGTGGVTYKLTCTVSTANGNTLVLVGYLKVLTE